METLVTSDIYMVAALLTKGAEIKLPIDTSDLRHYRFTLIGMDILNIKKDWMNNELVGNLSDYARSLKTVKMILHEKGD